MYYPLQGLVDRYGESTSTFCEFLGGYYSEHLIKLTSKEAPINLENLVDMEIVLRKTRSPSFQSSDDEVEEPDKP